MEATNRSGHGEFRRLRFAGGVLLVTLLLWYAGGKLDRAFVRFGVRTVEAVFGTVETRYEGTAIILRSESVVTSPAPGRITLLVGEGRHVRAGDLVIEVRDDGEGSRTAHSLDEINRRLASLESTYRMRQNELLRTKADVESRLAGAERALGEALARADRDAARQREAERDALRVELSAVEHSLSALAAELEAEREQLDAARQAMVALRPGEAALVRSPGAGVVSFSLDGLESELEPGMSALELFDRVTPVERRVQDGVEVRLGEPLFRVVETAVIEVAVRVRGLALDAGAQVTLDFQGIPERRFTGRLVESHTVGNEFIGRIRLDAFDPSLVYRRVTGVTLTTGRSQGIVVPASAVVEVDGRQGVYVMLGERSLFRPVRVLGANARQATVDGVPAGAAVVANPQRLTRR